MRINSGEIWREHPEYSDWLQDNRATYGTGMASDPLTIAAGNPYEGYLNFMGDHYAGNKSGTDWVNWQRGHYFGDTPNPIQPPVDPVEDNEDVIRDSANRSRVTSRTFR